MPDSGRVTNRFDDGLQARSLAVQQDTRRVDPCGDHDRDRDGDDQDSEAEHQLPRLDPPNGT